MDCNKCKSNNFQESEQLIDDLMDYLTSIGVSTKSMIATLIDMQERSKHLTPPPMPFRKEDR